MSFLKANIRCQRIFFCDQLNFLPMELHCRSDEVVLFLNTKLNLEIILKCLYLGIKGALQKMKHEKVKRLLLFKKNCLILINIEMSLL